MIVFKFLKGKLHLTDQNADELFWGLSAALLLYLPFLSRDFGISFDEWTMANGGLVTLRYLFSGGQDREALTFLGFNWQHPQFFNSLVGLFYGLKSGSLTQFLKEGFQAEKNLLPYFSLSHQMNAFFGFLAVFYGARISKMLGGARAGLITLLILALSPRFVGDMMNNSKDIPFAGVYAASVFYLLCFFKEMSAPRWQTILLLIFSFSAAIGIRVGGYLLLFYLVFFAPLFWVAWAFKQEGNWRGVVSRRTAGLKLFGRILLIVFAAYFGGMIFWPFAQVAPFQGPLIVFKQMSQFTAWDNFVLFQGSRIRASDLPWYYLPHWIAITVPFSCLTGWVLFGAFFYRLRRFCEWKLVLFALFAGFFPVAYIILKDSIVYDGWRHVLFIYAPLAAFAGMGWEALFQFLNSPRLRNIAAVILIFFYLGPLIWMIRNHPNQYVYFNGLVGGVNGAFGKYETDYFGNSLRAASEWLMEYHEKNYLYQPLIVRADGHVMSSYPYLSGKFHSWYLPLGYPRDFLQTDPHRFMYLGPYLQGPKVWSYALVLTRDWEPEALKNPNRWPPPGTIHTVMADDTILCAVVKNPQMPLINSST